MNTAPTKIFISYSHADEEWKDRLQVYLNAHIRLKRLIVWEDRQIRTGDEWSLEIEQAIMESNIAVLLVTANFINSSFIQDEEIPFIQKNGLKIMPIIVSPCAWTKFDYISKTQGFTKNNQCLKGLSEFQIEEELTRIAEELCCFSFMPKLLSPELKPFSETKVIFSDAVEASLFHLDKNEFVNCSEKYISNQIYLSKIESENSVENMINLLYESSQKEDLASIFYDLSSKIEFDDVLEKWMEEHYNPNNKQVVKEELKGKREDCIYVVMRHLEASQYDITISPRYGKGNQRQKSFVLDDIDSKVSQAEFIAQFRGLRPYIPIHLIVSEELYLQNIRLWEKRNRKLLDLANPLYLHTLERFDDALDNYDWMIKNWKSSFIEENLLTESLALLETGCCGYTGKDENDNGLLGVCYNYQPSTIDEIYDPLDLAYVSLWSHCTETEYQQKIIENFDKITIVELPHKVKKCQHLSLLWDDMRMLKDFKRELE